MDARARRKICAGHQHIDGVTNRTSKLVFALANCIGSRAGEKQTRRTKDQRFPNRVH